MGSLNQNLEFVLAPCKDAGQQNTPNTIALTGAQQEINLAAGWGGGDTLNRVQGAGSWFCFSARGANLKFAIKAATGGSSIGSGNGSIGMALRDGEVSPPVFVTPGATWLEYVADAAAGFIWMQAVSF